MKIIVENRWSVSEFKTDTPHIIISICEDQDFPIIPKQNSCKGILRLNFHDIEDDLDQDFINKYKLILINEIHAKQILDFIFENLNKIELIVCQCDAGISRSAGTAMALDKILNSQATTLHDLFLINSKFYNFPYMPNRSVCRKILEEYVKIKSGEKN